MLGVKTTYALPVGRSAAMLLNSVPRLCCKADAAGGPLRKDPISVAGTVHSKKLVESLQLQPEAKAS